MKDYIPRKDLAFNSWLSQFVDAVDEHSDALGLDREQVNTLRDSNTAWDTSLTNHMAAQNAAKAATTVKREQRKTTQDLVRGFVKQFQANPDIPDGLRKALGITVADTTPTDIEPPKASPLVRTDITNRFEHTLKIFNRDGGKGKPAGAVAAEIWIATTTPETGSSARGHLKPSIDNNARARVNATTRDDNDATNTSEPQLRGEDFHFGGLATRATFTKVWSFPDVGHRAHYMVRWINAKGEHGPWSRVSSMTIAA